MDQKSLNYILIIVIIILAFNLFYPIKSLYWKTSIDKLSCEINGNSVTDINLCCYEMSRFTSCKGGICSSTNYDIITNKETLSYCKSEGYDVRF